MMKSHLAVMLTLLLASLTMTPAATLSITRVSLSPHTTSTCTTNTNTPLARSESHGLSRAAFLSSTAFSVAMVLVPMAAPTHAATTDSSLKGTKKDPAFEACLSQCMYDCTKPKGVEQKSRTECLPECKQKCATTKAQLLKGIPASSN